MNKTTFIQNFIDDIWNHKKVSMVEQYVHEEYKIHFDANDPWEKQSLNHSKFKERLNYSFSSFSDIHFAITSILEAGDHVGITWILTGTNDGSINGLPPTNKKIRTRGMTIYYFNNGKIDGHCQVFDQQKVARQLGFI